MRKLVSYSKMNPELATALNIQFPNGIEQNVSTTKVGTQIVQTVMFEWDGISTILGNNHAGITIQKARFGVKLVRFDDQEYFDMLRSKLMWGVRKS